MGHALGRPLVAVELGDELFRDGHLLELVVVRLAYWEGSEKAPRRLLPSADPPSSVLPGIWMLSADDFAETISQSSDSRLRMRVVASHLSTVMVGTWGG